MINYIIYCTSTDIKLWVDHLLKRIAGSRFAHVVAVRCRHLLLLYLVLKLLLLVLFLSFLLLLDLLLDNFFFFFLNLHIFFVKEVFPVVVITRMVFLKFFTLKIIIINLATWTLTWFPRSRKGCFQTFFSYVEKWFVNF